MRKNCVGGRLVLIDIDLVWDFEVMLLELRGVMKTASSCKCK